MAESGTWNDNVMTLLDKIRLNSYQLSEKHRKRYIEFNSMSKYFDLPVIVMSVFSSSFSSLNSVPSNKTQTITTSISMVIAVLTSIKLYLNLSSNINDEIALSKEFYILSVNIFKITQLKESDRHIDPLEFVNTCYAQYIKLIEASSLLHHSIKKDELVNINIKKYDLSITSSPSSSEDPKNLNLKYLVSGSESSSLSSNDDSYNGDNPIITTSSNV